MTVMGSLHSQPSASLSFVDWLTGRACCRHSCCCAVYLFVCVKMAGGPAGAADADMLVMRCWCVYGAVGLWVWVSRWLWLAAGLLPRNRPVPGLAASQLAQRQHTPRTNMVSRGVEGGGERGKQVEQSNGAGLSGHSGAAILTVRPSVVCFSCRLLVQASVNKESVDAGIKAVKMRKARYALFKVEQRERQHWGRRTIAADRCSGGGWHSRASRQQLPLVRHASHR